MDKLEVIKKPIEKELSEFKALFDASLKSSTPLLDEVLGYIKQRNGKMMRPILVLLMAKLYGGINDSTASCCAFARVASYCQSGTR